MLAAATLGLLTEAMAGVRTAAGIDATCCLWWWPASAPAWGWRR
jgi:hypothetical protein